MKPSYTLEEKINAVQTFQAGIKTKYAIAQEMNVSVSLLDYWEKKLPEMMHKVQLEMTEPEKRVFTTNTVSACRVNLSELDKLSLRVVQPLIFAIEQALSSKEYLADNKMLLDLASAGSKVVEQATRIQKARLDTLTTLDNAAAQNPELLEATKPKEPTKSPAQKAKERQHRAIAEEALSRLAQQVAEKSAELQEKI